MEMKFSAEAKAVFLAFDHVTPQILQGIENGNHEAETLLTFEKDKQILDRRIKAGVTYLKRGRKFQRSAPGQTPSEESGSYRKSFKFEDQGGRGFIFGTTSPYGGFLEDGTSKMNARPGVENISKAMIGNLQNVYEKQIAKIIKADK